MGALYKGLIATAVLSLAGIALVIHWLLGFGTPLRTTGGVGFTSTTLFWCGVAGLVVTGLIIWITEYYTGTNYRPVKSIAQASVTGHGTNVIQGLAISMEATAMPAVVIVAGILVTYGMIFLHLALLLRRLAAAGATATIGQPLFDRFCQDIDDNLREMGVGDLAVPKQMRRVAEGFYGRAKAYDDALARDNEALTTAVARNVYGIANPQPHNTPLGAQRLAAYIREAVSALARQDPTALERAERVFPDP